MQKICYILLLALKWQVFYKDDFNKFFTFYSITIALLKYNFFLIND